MSQIIMMFSMVYHKAQYSVQFYFPCMLPIDQTTKQHGINFHLYTDETWLCILVIEMTSVP